MKLLSHLLLIIYFKKVLAQSIIEIYRYLNIMAIHARIENNVDDSAFTVSYLFIAAEIWPRLRRRYPQNYFGLTQIYVPFMTVYLLFLFYSYPLKSKSKQ